MAIGADLTTMEAVTKTHYLPAMVDKLNNTNPYWSRIKKTAEFITMHGRDLKAYWPIKLRNNKGSGIRPAKAVMPTPRANKYLELNVDLKRMYGTMKFDGDSLAATSQSETRFVEVIDSETMGLKTGYENDLASYVIMPSFGWLAQCNGAGGGADATVTIDGPGTIYLEEGMPIETREFTVATGVGTIAAAVGDQDISQGLTDGTAHQVGTIDEDNRTSFELEDYLDASISTEKWSTNRFIFRYGNPVAGTSPTSMHGLLTIIDNYRLQAASKSSAFGLDLGLISLQGQNKSTYPKLDAIVVHNEGSNRAFTEELFQEGLDRVHIRTGQDHKNRYALMNQALRRSFVSLLQSDRAFTTDKMTLKGGWKTVAYQAGNNQIAIIEERKIPNNMVFVPDMEDMMIHRHKEPAFMDLAGGSMFRQYHDSSGEYDAFIATLFSYMEQGSKYPGSGLAFRDVA